MTGIRDLFRDNLRKLRKAKGLSQRELSKRCDYTRSYVGQLERGEKDPSFESLIRLANALDLSILDFFRNDSEGLEVELVDALEEMTNFSETNIRSMTTIPEIMNWEYRMVSLLNPQGRFLDLNRSAFDFISEPQEEIIGLQAWELDIFEADKGHKDWLRESIRVVTEEEKICRGVLEVIPESSGPTDLEITFTPISMVGSENCYVIGEGHRLRDMADVESPSSPS